LNLGLEAKRTEKDAIWSLIYLEDVIARPGITAEPEQVDTSLETR